MSDFIFVGACSFLGGMAFMFFLLCVVLTEKNPRPSDFNGYEGGNGK